MGLLNGASTFASLVQTLIGVMDMLVSVLGAAALVVFFIGLVRYIRAAGDAKAHTEGRERIVWSIIALFILFSIWGILNVMSIAFFGSSTLPNGTYNTSGATQGSSNPFNSTGSLY